MMNELLWYPIGTRLVDFMKSYRYNDGKRLFEYVTDRDVMQFRFGSGNSGEYPAVWVLFGEETDTEKQSQRVGSVIQFWIDIYVKGEQTPDMTYDSWLYAQMYEIEQELTKVLKEFNIKLQRDFKLGVLCKLRTILSDGDENYSASAMHRAVVDIEWYK